MKVKLLALSLSAVILGGLFLQGCSQNSYPSEKIKESLLKICREEYGIEEIDVHIIDDTIGVYLPLTKLFAADFKETAITGKVRNLETLFEPSPEALEKVEDVLFSMSRVLLSTDKPLRFYVLEATDVEKTGMQLVLTGNVDDIKRVRIWDISRNEYRKRVIHELRLNRAVLWHKPVREFFKDAETLSAQALTTRYFGDAISSDTLQVLFMNALGSEDPAVKKATWEVVDVRSASVQKNQVLVYTKVHSDLGDAKGEKIELQYIFLLSLNEEQAKIVRIIPFQFKNDEGGLERIPFPKELQIQENLDRWETEFPLEAVKMGPFLAQQLTRRVQALLSTDERIQNTFRDVRLNFEYQEAEPAYFSLDLEATLRDFNNYNRQSLVFHEDMIYLLTLASQEFVEVLRSYQFGNYDYLRLNVAQDPTPWVLGREDLEMFRRKKVDLQGLLTLPRI